MKKFILILFILLIATSSIFAVTNEETKSLAAEVSDTDALESPFKKILSIITGPWLYVFIIIELIAFGIMLALNKEWDAHKKKKAIIFAAGILLITLAPSIVNTLFDNLIGKSGALVLQEVIR